MLIVKNALSSRNGKYSLEYFISIQRSQLCLLLYTLHFIRVVCTEFIINHNEHFHNYWTNIGSILVCRYLPYC